MARMAQAALCAAVVAGIVGTAEPVSAQATPEEPYRWSGTLASGMVLEVKGILGSIVAQPASGRTAEVIAEKRGRSSDFQDVEIRMVQESDGITICAVHHPEDYDTDDCDLDDRRRDDRNRRRGSRVEVDFTVMVPEGVELIASIVSGDVDVQGLRSDVVAHSVSGDVSVSTTGVVEAGTVSGSLDLDMGSLDWRRMSFNTVSGDITLRLPAALEAEVDFQSVSGDFDSDFDVQVTRRRDGRFVGSRVEGTIGSGGRSLSLRTVSGDARLLRAR